MSKHVLFLRALLLLTMATASSFGGPGSAEPVQEERRFESTRALEVWALDPSKAGSANDLPELLGTTPTPDGKGIPIPIHARWWVKPMDLGDVELALLATELLEGKVPGLNLSFAKITDAGLAHLKNLKSLTVLALGGTNITDAGLAQLKDLKSLTRLDLGKTHITDAGLTQIKGLASLTWLSLMGTQTTDAGVKDLRSARPGLIIDGLTLETK